MKLAEMDSSGKPRLPGVLIIWALFSAGMVANFFLTANPYAALHSGQVALLAEDHSTGWVLHVGILMALSIGTAVLVRTRRVPQVFVLGVLVIVPWVVLSGVISTAIWSFPASYGFTLLSFTGVAIVAYTDKTRMRSVKGKTFIWLVISLYLIGMVLALLRPDVWGSIPFEFSRVERGEITLASITSLSLLLTTSFVSFPRGRNILTGVVIGLIAIVEFSFLTRSTIMVITVPLAMAVVFYILRSIADRSARNVIQRLTFAGYLVGLCAVVFGIYWSLSQDELVIFLNHRWSLWIWHLEMFRDNILFGVGVFPTARFTDYVGRATSEIGVLAVFSQYGVVVGTLQVFLVLKAVKRGIDFWLDSRATEMTRFCGMVVIVMFPHWLFQGSWRIIASADLLFWYSVFFLSFVKYSRFDGAMDGLRTRLLYGETGGQAAIKGTSQ